MSYNPQVVQCVLMQGANKEQPSIKNRLRCLIIFAASVIYNIQYADWIRRQTLMAVNMAQLSVFYNLQLILNY
jgi:hypothetical protein